MSAHEAAADDALRPRKGRSVASTQQGIASLAPALPCRAAIDNSANQAPEDKLITGYGQAYREWLIRGAQVGYARMRGVNVKSRAGG
jgi:hypothetical protein